jgi:metal-responsive CopG/Arc/MetJ family transcriptional regulator
VSDQFSNVVVTFSVTSILLSTKLCNKLGEIKYEKGFSSRSEVVIDAVKTYPNRKYQRLKKEL